MTYEYKVQRHKVLDQIEQELKNKRDFEGLLKIHDESMELFNSIANHYERIPQIAYCLARLGRIKDAENTLNKMNYASLFMDKDELFRIVTLVSFFLQTELKNFDLMQLNTIRNWLKDPEASKQVIQIVFDYKDIVADTEPFDIKRLNCRQTNFSQKLIDCIFVSMSRDEETKIYYNKEINSVQQEVEDYLCDSLAEDQSTENQLLANRIFNFESIDPIIKGIHYLIPRIKLNEFLINFRESASKYKELQNFINEFEVYIFEDFKDYIDDIDELFFGFDISEKFDTQLNRWYNENTFDFENLRTILNKTTKSIALNYLREINGIEED